MYLAKCKHKTRGDKVRDISFLSSTRRAPRVLSSIPEEIPKFGRLCKYFAEAGDAANEIRFFSQLILEPQIEVSNEKHVDRDGWELLPRVKEFLELMKETMTKGGTDLKVAGT